MDIRFVDFVLKAIIWGYAISIMIKRGRENRASLAELESQNATFYTKPTGFSHAYKMVQVPCVLFLFFSFLFEKKEYYWVGAFIYFCIFTLLIYLAVRFNKKSYSQWVMIKSLGLFRTNQRHDVIAFSEITKLKFRESFISNFPDVAKVYTAKKHFIIPMTHSHFVTLRQLAKLTENAIKAQGNASKSMNTQLKKRIATAVLVLGILFAVFGGASFFIGVEASIAENRQDATFSSKEYRLGEMCDPVVDMKDRIYCYGQIDNAINVYDAKGKFLYSIEIQGGSNGAANITNRGNKIVVFSKLNQIYFFEDGKLLDKHEWNEKIDAPILQKMLVKGQFENVDSHGNIYRKGAFSSLYPTVIQKTKDGKIRTIIQMPFFRWITMAPMPAWGIGFMGMILITIYKLLLQKKETAQRETQDIDSIVSDNAPKR